MSQVKTSAQDGFSLVEIVIAIMILSFGLLAMAASTGYVFNQLRSTGWDTQRALARQEVAEQLRGMFWDDIPTNAAQTVTVGRYTIRYLATTPNSAVKQVTIITSGPAYRKVSGRGAAYSTAVDTSFIEVVRPI